VCSSDLLLLILVGAAFWWMWRRESRL